MNITDKVQVGDSTTGTSTSTTQRYPYTPSKAEQGWECPRCGRINAPWKSQCDCSNWTYKPEWWCNSDTFKIHPYEITYTTAHNTVVGGSDYWDNTEKIWSNTLKNISNIKEIY